MMKTMNMTMIKTTVAATTTKTMTTATMTTTATTTTTMTMTTTTTMTTTMTRTSVRHLKQVFSKFFPRFFEPFNFLHSVPEKDFCDSLRGGKKCVGEELGRMMKVDRTFHKLACLPSAEWTTKGVRHSEDHGSNTDLFDFIQFNYSNPIYLIQLRLQGLVFQPNSEALKLLQ